MGDARAERGWWPIAALALGGIAVSLLVHHFVFPAYSWNRDEPVYLWQVAGLKAGQFTTTTGGFPTFFHPWLAGVRHGSFFSQYTLGWPVVLLVADVVVGSPVGAIALGTALTVVGTYLLALEILDDRRTALIAGTAMLISPIVVIQSGVFLGYLFTLGLGLLFATALCSGVRTGRRCRIVVAGLLVGWIFMTRPFDAVLWGGAVSVALVWQHRKDLARVRRAVLPLAAGIVPLLIATLAYNQHVTGSFTQFPITAADPLDTFGFGFKRIMPTFDPAEYTLVQAFRSSGKQAGLLPLFLTGGYVLGAVALWGLWRRRHDRGIGVLVAIAVAFPVGYFFFWGMFVSSATMPLSGPIYYIPVYPVLTIVGVAEMLRLWQERRGLAIGLLVAMVVVTLPVEVNRVDANRRISQSQVPWKDSSSAVPARSLVFVWRAGDYLLFLNPYSVNRPNLDGDVLWAVDRGTQNFALLDAYPGRTAYLQRTSVPPIGEVPNDHPETPEVTLTRLRVQRAPGFLLRTRVHGGSMPSGVRFYARAHGKVLDWPRAAPRRTRATLRLAAQPGPNAVLDPRTAGTVTIGIGRGRTAKQAARHALRREDLHYRVRDGRVELLRPFESFRRGRYGLSRRWFAVAPGVRSSVSLDTVPVPLRK